MNTKKSDTLDNILNQSNEQSNKVNSISFEAKNIRERIAENKAVMRRATKSRSRCLKFEFDRWTDHIKKIGKHQYSRIELLQILGTFMNAIAEDCVTVIPESQEMLGIIQSELEERSSILEQCYLTMVNLPKPLEDLDSRRRLKLAENVRLEEQRVGDQVGELKSRCEGTLLLPAINDFQNDCASYFKRISDLISDNYSLDQISREMKAERCKLEFCYECLATDYFVYATKKAQLREYDDPELYWSTNMSLRRTLECQHQDVSKLLTEMECMFYSQEELNPEE